jgi:hypothetical protein
MAEASVASFGAGAKADQATPKRFAEPRGPRLKVMARSPCVGREGGTLSLIRTRRVFRAAREQWNGGFFNHERHESHEWGQGQRQRHRGTRG